MENVVDLGFAEKCPDNWRLLSHYFPSKLGGPPAWLALDNIPGHDRLRCANCGKVCKFLLQVYSPGGEELESDLNAGTSVSVSVTRESNAFHRTLFIFVCSENPCTKRSLICLRSQLPRVNNFYDSSPPNEDCFDESQPYPKATDFTKLCEVCQCHAPKSCSQCKSVSYCSREHQAIDWKTKHKKVCCVKEGERAADAVSPDTSTRGYFFDEYEIVIEPEELSAQQNKSEEEILKEYQNYVISNKSSEKTVDSQEWDAVPEPSVADEAFLEFREKISSQPDQIIRYNKSGVPLLVSNETAPPEVIPPCATCGGHREFEFQIMPQTLSYLKVDTSLDSLDWGTLLVYTCKTSCNIQGYAEEFVWKQDFSNKDVVETKSSEK